MSRRRYEPGYQDKRASILSKKIVAVFEKQEKYIREAIKDYYPQVKKNFQGNFIDEIVGSIPNIDEMIDAIINENTLVMRRSSSFILKTLGLSKIKTAYSFNLENTAAMAALAQREKFELSAFRGSITDTTQQGLKKILEDSVRLGRSYDDTALLINQQLDSGVFSVSRGKTIAVNEIGRSYGEGNWAVVQDFNDEFADVEITKEWVTVGDSLVRPGHVKNGNDGIIPLRQLHSGTNELHAPSRDYNCRCFSAYDIL